MLMSVNEAGCDLDDAVVEVDVEVGGRKLVIPPVDAPVEIVTILFCRSQIVACKAAICELCD